MLPWLAVALEFTDQLCIFLWWQEKKACCKGHQCRTTCPPRKTREKWEIVCKQAWQVQPNTCLYWSIYCYLVGTQLKEPTQPHGNINSFYGSLDSFPSTFYFLHLQVQSAMHAQTAHTHTRKHSETSTVKTAQWSYWCSGTSLQCIGFCQDTWNLKEIVMRSGSTNVARKVQNLAKQWILLVCTLSKERAHLINTASIWAGQWYEPDMSMLLKVGTEIIQTRITNEYK